MVTGILGSFGASPERIVAGTFHESTSWNGNCNVSNSKISIPNENTGTIELKIRTDIF